MDEELYVGVLEKELEETKSRSFMLGWYVGVLCVVGAIMTTWTIMWVY